MDQQHIEQIFQRLQRAIPNPASELEYRSHFELLIAVMLSAQATDESVNRATRQLFQVANTPQTILDLGEQQLKKYIQSIGLYNSKAHNIIRACAKLIDQYEGRVPDKRADLESLPGVGRKTANVILNTAFGHDAVAVDTHIFRVANRTQIAPGNTTRQVEEHLIANVPQAYLPTAHHLLILHGRYTCTARQPKCPQCVINDLCPYPYKTQTTDA